jgi:glutamine amidotransferase
MSGLRVQIVDYGLGNLFSIRQACLQAGITAEISSSGESLPEVDGIILPGVGAFGHAMDTLRAQSLIEPLLDAVAAGKPLLGICLGMQLLMDASEEFGVHKGLGLIPGIVRRLPERRPDGELLRVPAVGWNQIRLNPERANPETECGFRDGQWVYFVHSFAAVPEQAADILTLTDYHGIRYCSAVMRGRVTGVQFHPERSAAGGIAFFRHWASRLA